MIKAPLVSVLMPVYNCELYIKEAIESILNQTYANFELLLIEDCSTDTTLQICKSFQDDRIVIIEKEKNSGYTNSLNYGLSIARGKYIARMDGDDISLPERFEKQVTFMESNKEVIVCGTLYKLLDRDEVYILPEYHEDIKIKLLYGNCLGHPTIMIRKSVLINNDLKYDTVMEPAEDYDLWVRLIGLGKIHNLQQVLLHYRVHNTQVSMIKNIQQNKSALKSRLQMLQYLKYSFNKIENDLIKKILPGSSTATLTEIKNFSILKDRMIIINNGVFFNAKGFEEYLNILQKKAYKNYFQKRENFNPLVFMQYFFYRKKIKLELIDELKLFIKSLIFYKI